MYKTVTTDQINARDAAIARPLYRMTDIYSDFNTLVSRYLENRHSGPLSHSNTPDAQVDYTTISLYTSTYDQLIEPDNRLYDSFHSVISKSSILVSVLDNYAMVSYVRAHCPSATSASEADISTSPVFEPYRSEFSRMYSSGSAINSMTSIPHPSELAQSPLYTAYLSEYNSVVNIMLPKCIRNLAFRFISSLSTPFNRREYAFRLHEFLAGYRDGTNFTADHDMVLGFLTEPTPVAKELALLRKLNASIIDILFTETMDPVANTKIPPAIDLGSKDAILRRFPNDTTRSYLYNDGGINRAMPYVRDVVPLFRAYFNHIECIVYIYDIADLYDPNRVTTTDTHTVIQSVEIPLSNDDNFQAYISQPSVIGPEFSVEITNHTPAQMELKRFIELFYLCHGAYPVSALVLGAPYYPEDYSVSPNVSNMITLIFTLTDINAYGKTQYIGPYVGKCIALMNPTIDHRHIYNMITIAKASTTLDVRNLRVPSVLTPFAGGEYNPSTPYGYQDDNPSTPYGFEDDNPYANLKPSDYQDYQNDNPYANLANSTDHSSRQRDSSRSDHTSDYHWWDITATRYRHPDSILIYILLAIVGVAIIALLVIIYRRTPKWEVDYSSYLTAADNAFGNANMLSPTATPVATPVLPSSVVPDGAVVIPPVDGPVDGVVNGPVVIPDGAVVVEGFGPGDTDVIVIDPATNASMVIPTGSATPTSTVITPVAPVASNAIPSVAPVVPAGPSVVATPVVAPVTISTSSTTPSSVPVGVPPRPPHMKLNDTVPGFNPMTAEVIPVQKTEAVIVPVDKTLSNVISTMPVSKPVVIPTVTPVSTDASTMVTDAPTPVIVPIDSSVTAAMTTVPVSSPVTPANTPVTSPVANNAPAPVLPIPTPNVIVPQPDEVITPLPTMTPKRFPGDISTTGVSRDVIARPHHPSTYKIYDYVTGKVSCDGAHLRDVGKPVRPVVGNNLTVDPVSVVNSNATTEMFTVRYARH